MALLLLGGGSILTSCEKDQTETQKTYETTGDFANIEKQIKEFKTTMTDKHKSGEVIELKQAVWMMEATFNYYHGFTGEDYLTMVTDTAYIPVNYTGFDNVPVDELQQIYKQVNNAIYYSFVNYKGENKKPYLFDLELQATPQGSQIAVYTTVGSVNTQKGAKGIKATYPFNSTDYWHPAYRYGKCGDYNGEYHGERDAGTEWTRLILKKHKPNGLYHFVDIDDETGSGQDVTYNEYPYDVPFAYCEDYRLYVGILECLTPEMMSFYYHQLDYIVKDKCPQGKRLATINVASGWHDNNEPYHYETNIRQLRYGIPVSYVAEAKPCYPSEIP